MKSADHDRWFEGLSEWEERMLTPPTDAEIWAKVRAMEAEEKAKEEVERKAREAREHAERKAAWRAQPIRVKSFEVD